VTKEFDQTKMLKVISDGVVHQSLEGTFSSISKRSLRLSRSNLDADSLDNSTSKYDTQNFRKVFKPDTSEYKDGKSMISSS